MSRTKDFLPLDPDTEEQLRYEQIDRVYQYEIEARMIAAAERREELAVSLQPMGSIKHYLIRLMTSCSEHAFGQDAIQHAILNGSIKLTYDLEVDQRAIMARYDDLITAYQNHTHTCESAACACSPYRQAA